MKKLVSMLLALVMCLSLLSLVACTPAKGIPGWTLEDGETYNGEQVTIVFANTMGERLRTVLEDYIVEFNKLYPNITVQISTESNYNVLRDSIKTQITTNEQPNIAYCYPDHVAMYNLSGKVVVLDQFINNDDLGFTQAQIDDFIDGYYEEGRQFGDGFMYTLPFSKSTEVLYYNKTYFEANGLSVPTTWDEMEQVCREILRIQNAAGDYKCIPLGYDSESNWFITMTEQLGTPYTSSDKDGHYLFNTDENKAFVERFAKWHYEGLVTTEALNGGKYTSNLFVEQDIANNSHSYMSIGSSAGSTYQRPDAVDGKYPFEVGIATIPQVNSNDPKVISQGPSVCIFTSDNRQEVIASWLFVKFLTTSVEFQAEFSMTSGYVPVLESVADHPTYKAFLESADGGDNIAALSASVCMKQANAYYTSPAFNGSSEARDQVGLLLQSVMSGYGEATKNGTVKALIDEAFKNAVQRCENYS